jgi:hypothetical protein
MIAFCFFLFPAPPLFRCNVFLIFSGRGGGGVYSVCLRHSSLVLFFLGRAETDTMRWLLFFRRSLVSLPLLNNVVAFPSASRSTLPPHSSFFACQIYEIAEAQAWCEPLPSHTTINLSDVSTPPSFPLPLTHFTTTISKLQQGRSPNISPQLFAFMVGS